MSKLKPSDRDKSGRLLPGHKGGGGRPRGSFDFRAIVRRKAEEEGVDIDDALWDVFKSVLAAARDGDMTAARIIIDRLCENDPIKLNMNVQISDEERDARVEQLLQVAEERRRLKIKIVDGNEQGTPEVPDEAGA